MSDTFLSLLPESSNAAWNIKFPAYIPPTRGWEAQLPEADRLVHSGQSHEITAHDPLFIVRNFLRPVHPLVGHASLTTFFTSPSSTGTEAIQFSHATASFTEQSGVNLPLVNSSAS